MAAVSVGSASEMSEFFAVIVDMREFRSALPSMLHQRGLLVLIRLETAFIVSDAHGNAL